MEDLKQIIAKNICSLRRESELTQFELAERLNYSDKAVSKWERGESVPDIAVLKEIADLFGVTVDYLLEAEHTKKNNFTERLRVRMQNHGFIMGMSITLVWLVALMIYVFGDLFREYIGPQYWLVFVFAVPASLIVWLVFNSVWFNPRRNFLIVSCLMWSCILAIYVALISLWRINFRLFPLLGIPGQAIIVMWSRIKRK
ncbi:MAG: helix-turn-helix transcriptional regulator [Oscillospiraceae bacterium]|nr:helix-turn-helix transcriptional regulator [Oscillospiraceae bacterium]